MLVTSFPWCMVSWGQDGRSCSIDSSLDGMHNRSIRLDGNGAVSTRMSLRDAFYMTWGLAK